MKRSVVVALALGGLLMVSACADERVVPQKTPCVGAEGSPCGPKRLMNGQLNTMSELMVVATLRA